MGGLGQRTNFNSQTDLNLASQKKESIDHLGLIYDSGFYTPRVKIYHSMNDKGVN